MPVVDNLEYASVVPNSITSVDGSKLEFIQQKFAGLPVLIAAFLML
jgi:hypothetical protein